MNLINQGSAIEALDELARTRSHAILIDGSQGVGKSYLSRYFASKLGVEAFLSIEPKVDAVKEAIDNCYSVDNDVVLSIENLDCGVVGVAYAMLKFLEEPPENVYVVITCRNIRQIPDTILSRSIRISVPPMLTSDILSYLRSTNCPNAGMIEQKFSSCLKSFADVDLMVSLSIDKLNYLSSIMSFVTLKDPISSIVWKLQKYPDSTPTPLPIVIRYMMANHAGWAIPCINCLDDMNYSRVSDHAALSKLLMTIKYGV